MLLVAAALRLISLGEPPIRYGDEYNYALDRSGNFAPAPLISRTPVPPPPGVLTIQGDLSWVHPPLAKILIAWSQQLGGFTPLSWRLPSAIFGIAGVALVFAVGLALWRSAWWASLTALLLAEDGLHIVQSRMAMLDIFMSTFLVAGLLCLVLAWRAQTSAAMRWQLLAGALFGAAIASKWSALFVAGPAVVLWAVLTWRRFRLRLVWPVAAIAAVYLASYAQFFVQHGPAFGGFVRLQGAMLGYHEDLDLRNPMTSRAETWPLMLHPNTYYYGGDGFSPAGTPLPTSHEKEITTVGNPALWWPWLALAPLGACLALRRRCWPALLPLAAYLCAWLPWLFIGRAEFFYYMLPGVPFMALGACAALRQLPSRAAIPLGALIAVASTLAAVAFAPHWLGLPIPLSWGQHLRWLSGWM